MKEIILRSIAIRNFKGCESLTVDFEKETTISGRNATFKSTCYDAFAWVLTGKNASDEKSFNIKNTKKLALNKNDHEVKVVISVDGQSYELRKVYKEKWQKQKGNEFETFTGHTTDYYFDSVPMGESEYKSALERLVPENIIKLITNVFYFNDLDWKVRREILSEISGGVTNEEVAEGNEDFKKLLVYLGNKSFDGFLAEIRSKMKDIQKELDAIPSRIDEASRAIKEDINFELLKVEILGHEASIKEIESVKNDLAQEVRTQSDVLVKAQQELADKKVKLNTLLNSEKEKYLKGCDNLKETLAQLKQNKEHYVKRLDTLVSEKSNLENDLSASKTKLVNLKSKYAEINARTIPVVDINSYSCNSCGRAFDGINLEELNKENKEKFEAALKQDKEDNIAQGKKVSQEIIKTEESIKESDRLIEEAKSKITGWESEIKSVATDISSYENNMDILDTDEITSLKKEIETFVVPEIKPVDISSHNARIEDLRSKITELSTLVSQESVNENQKRRIEELKQQESELSKNKAQYEKTEFVMSQFVKVKSALIQDKVNGMFKETTFRMFEDQINGQQVPACVALYYDVPYASVNTAGKINMGLDIISVLSNYYGYRLPVFIDNAESVIQFIDTPLQLIKLRATEDKSLNVTHNKLF